MKMRRSHSSGTPGSPALFSSPSPDSGPNPKRKRIVEAIDFSFDPPSPVNLKCTEGRVYGPLWTLWTVWSPESPLSKAKKNSKTGQVQFKHEYLKLFYDTLRAYNTEFALTDNEARTTHIIDSIGVPGFCCGKYIYPVRIKEFPGSHAVGDWNLEVCGDLGEILSSALGSFEDGQDLLILGASTNFLQHTITLNERFESRKAQIIHYVNTKNVTECEDYYRPYGVSIETANIQMVYFTAKTQPGRVLKMSPYVGGTLEVATLNSWNNQLGHLHTNLNDSRNSSESHRSGSDGQLQTNQNDSTNSLERSGSIGHSHVENISNVSDSENLLLTPFYPRNRIDASPNSTDSGESIETHLTPAQPSHPTDPLTHQESDPDSRAVPNSSNFGNSPRQLDQNGLHPGDPQEHSRVLPSQPNSPVSAEHLHDQPRLRTSRRSRRTRNRQRNETHDRRMEKMEKGSEYVYSTLKECREELTAEGFGPEGYKTIWKHINIYGVVQEIIRTNVAGAYEIRIYDETYEGIQVRIHTNSLFPKVGPKIHLNDIIRIHRATIQEELTGLTRDLVISTSPHHNYILFNYDPVVTGEIIGQTSAKTTTRRDYDVRRVKELRQLILSREEQLLESQSPSDARGHNS